MNKTEYIINVSLEKQKDIFVGNTQVAWVNFKKQNSIVQKCYVKFHGNLITVFFNDNTTFNLWISNCGYYTKKTKTRLNTILEWYYKYQITAVDEFDADLFQIYQSQHKWYITQKTIPFESFNYDSLVIDGWISIHRVKRMIADRIYL